MHTGQVDVEPRAKSPGSNDPASNPLSPFFDDHQPDHSVVHQNGVANGDIVYQSVIIHFDRIGLFAFGAGNGQLQNVVLLQMEIGLEISDANGRPLSIEQNPNGSAGLFCEGTNTRDNFTHGAMIGMAHGQSKNIRSFLDWLPQNGGF